MVHCRCGAAAGGRCAHRCRSAFVRRERRVGAIVQQPRDGLRASRLHGGHQRRPSFVGRLVLVGPALQARSDDVDVALLSCHVQRRRTHVC